MSQTNTQFFPPGATIESLDRLAALPQEPVFSPEFWGVVHDEVQAWLASLEADVCRKAPDVRVTPGRTRGDRFFLFSYRHFSVPDSDIDPAVAGVTFTPAERGVTVEADVSGERTGDWVLPPTNKTATQSRREVLIAARELAQFLCQSAEQIIAALTDSTRRAV